MFTVEKKAIRFDAYIAPGKSKLLNAIFSFFGRGKGIITENWCVMSPSNSLVCICITEIDANMVEIALNRVRE